jgi:hypothetical protein
MPRKYSRELGCRINQRYSKATLQEAVQRIKANTCSYATAVEKYGIPRATLRNHVNRPELKQYGGQTTLSTKEEKEVVKGIVLASEWGYPFTGTDIR